ncbi:hypothetical protein DFR58_10152 [Anaerobacterium chartisolvens]|uniref:Uncharacterized protein n=1 Tax=Anaerobacterium chartisolvens TaxID=1297424 RepID=A0A369BH22_9FIRM|nr:hypothetical protein [Anaerobacterium chartisolvens]RCX20850.1 hypothetical protein DFR58_10152 [Anaerobacterium chartisolvens]
MMDELERNYKTQDELVELGEQGMEVFAAYINGLEKELMETYGPQAEFSPDYRDCIFSAAEELGWEYEEYFKALGWGYPNYHSEEGKE